MWIQTECLCAHKLKQIGDESSLNLSSGILKIHVEYLVGVVGCLVRFFNESEIQTHLLKVYPSQWIGKTWLFFLFLVSSSTFSTRLIQEVFLVWQDIIEAESKLFVQTYARSPVVFVSGEGCKLYDTEDKEYLDLTAGIAVNALGHGDPAWVKAVS